KKKKKKKKDHNSLNRGKLGVASPFEIFHWCNVTTPIGVDGVKDGIDQCDIQVIFKVVSQFLSFNFQIIVVVNIFQIQRLQSLPKPFCILLLHANNIHIYTYMYIHICKYIKGGGVLANNNTIKLNLKKKKKSKVKFVMKYVNFDNLFLFDGNLLSIKKNTNV
ncbi:hypothetical protein RFI_17750, partial [Reticulomyxa filosa]